MQIAHLTSPTMRHKLRHLTLCLSTISAGCMITPTTPSTHNARATLDWPAVYSGQLPDASGSAHQSLLILNQNGSYRLLQNNHQQNQTHATVNHGHFTWNADNTAITLESQNAAQPQHFLISKNFAKLQNQNHGANKTAAVYQLQQLKRYHKDAEELLIDPATIKTDPQRPKRIYFEGLWNMPAEQTQSGHGSLFAQFVLDCQAQSYTMPTITYYAQAYRQGGVLHQARDNNNPIPNANPDNTLMGSVFNAWCR